MHENVGDGTPVAVELSVKWFDAEDNRPVQGDGVMLNGEPMQQDMQDPLIWRAWCPCLQEALHYRQLVMWVLHPK